MWSDPDDIARLLGVGLRNAQQHLCQIPGAALRDDGLALHLAAFAAVCYGAHAASGHGVEVADLQPSVEKGLRCLCSQWDERPVHRRTHSLLGRLRRYGEDPHAQPALMDTQAVSVAIPGHPRPRVGQRGNYAVGRYRRYLDGVYIYSCDPRRAGTWDEHGVEGALERALYRDVFRRPPRLAASPSAFGAVVQSYAETEPAHGGRNTPAFGRLEASHLS